MTIEQLVQKILEDMGTRSNVMTATNCMTRLRINVKNDSLVKEDSLKAIEGVLGVVHDRANYWEVVVGPGKCRKCSDYCKELGIPAAADASAVSTDNDWKANKAAVKAGQKENKVKSMLKTFGDIFVPLIPGVIAAGLCAGLNTLLGQLFKGSEAPAFILITNFLSMINTAFMTYLTAWAGYRAAEKFGGTPILGGMLAMAGGGQVGAAIAIYLKCKKVGNNRLKSVITGALPAGILGVGEPLIYGVTLPMGKPFITAGLGAGFGGAFVNLMQVASTTWGPSGLLGCFVMTAGPNGAALSVTYFVIGLIISYIMGFIFTNLAIKPEEVANA